MADSGFEAPDARALPRVAPSGDDPGSRPGQGRAAPPGESLAGGLVLVVFALFALWALRDLDGGSLRQIGSGGLPRAVAILLALLGLVIAIRGWRTETARFARLAARPVVMILLAILVFAATIRPLALGLPIPAMPIGLLDWFPGWSQRAVLRVLAGLLIVIAAGLYLVRRRRGAVA